MRSVRDRPRHCENSILNTTRYTAQVNDLLLPPRRPTLPPSALIGAYYRYYIRFPDVATRTPGAQERFNLFTGPRSRTSISNISVVCLSVCLIHSLFVCSSFLYYMTEEAIHDLCWLKFETISIDEL